jgi:hypothetical protein
MILGVALLAALATVAGTAAASPANTFHSPEQCQTIASRTICFEAWGVDKATETASGNTIVVSNAHRRFTEFVGSVLTFEQRDMSHQLIQIRGMEAHVDNSMFVGTVDHPTLGLCRFREHILVRNGQVVHTIDEFTCS